MWPVHMALGVKVTTGQGLCSAPTIVHPEGGRQAAGSSLSTTALTGL